MTRLRRVAVVVAFVGATFALVSPSRSVAADGGPMTYNQGQWTGTASADVLVLGTDSGYFTHNRFAAGDPGFASNQDFDTATEGTQKLLVGDLANFNFDFKGGDDTLKFTGLMPGSVRVYSADYGSGFDTIDLSELSTSQQGSGVIYGPQWGVEKVIGTSYDDTLDGQYATTAITLIGGPGHDILKSGSGNDVLDGGSGDTELNAGSGNDTVTLEAPFPSTLRDILLGDDPDDTLNIRGATSADDLAVISSPDYTTRLISGEAIEGGYRVYGAEHQSLDARGGDDSLYVDSQWGGITVDGGSGNDELSVDANQATASVTNSSGDRVFTLPAPYGPHGEYAVPSAMRVKPSIESMSVFNETLIATSPGPGGGPHVRTFRADGTPIGSFYAYAPNFSGGVSVALGDLDGDFEDEIITGAGPGGGPHVRVFHADGTDAGTSFFAYGNSFDGGVNVAAADLDNDGVDEIVTVPASGGSPHVRIWSAEGELLEEWFAEGFEGFGLQVSRGNQPNEIGGQNINISSNGGASLVSVFNPVGDYDERYDDFVPYPGFTGGASVSRLDIIGVDGFSLHNLSRQIVTGAGPGGGPHVRVVSNRNDGGFNNDASFFAYDPAFRGGVNVAACNPDGGEDEILTGAGPGGGPHVRMFTKAGVPTLTSFYAYLPNFVAGARVACGGAETKSY